jgi:hypothetical protein
MATSEWEPAARSDASPVGPLRQFFRDAAHHPAWWIVPAVVTLAAVATLLLLARGDVGIPDVYRIS